MSKPAFTPGPWQVGYGDNKGLPTKGWPDREIEITTVATRRVIQHGVGTRKVPGGVEIYSDPNAKPIDWGDMALVVCKTESQRDIRTETRVANAYLISAAPALYAAGEVALADLAIAGRATYPASAVIRAALALARGEQP